MRAAIIPTHNRPQMLNALIGTIIDDVDLIVIVDNASSPPFSCNKKRATCNIIVIYDNEQPPNLSRLWNIGLNTVTSYMNARNIDAYDVAIFNDDTELPAQWFNTVSHYLRTHNTAAAASTASYSSVPRIIEKMRPDNDLMHRMCPWAFIVRGELGIRADESLRWWWGDTDFDWTCRSRGGVIIVPGEPPRNLAANSTTVGPLLEQAGRDGEVFTHKWGWRPW